MAEEHDSPTSTGSEGEQTKPSPPATATPPQKGVENDTLPDEIATRVRQTIRDAHALLEFAVADGLPVENAIVEEVIKSLRFVDQSRPLTWQDCAAFEQAYRKLAHALSPLTIEEVKQQAQPWYKRVSGRIVLTSVLSACLLFLLGQMACRNWMAWLNCALCTEREMGIGAVAVGLSFIIFLWWGAKPFTGAVTNRKLNQIIWVCYIFTLLALSLSVLPFVSMSFFPMFPRIMTLSPINVLQGCADPWPADGANPAEIPKEIRCVKDESVGKPSAYQWLVNIGGEVVAVSGYQKSDGAVQACAVYSDGFREDRWRIQGGLVVPLYVVVLALMGSAVSMTRRVPEYQRQAFGSQETLTNAQARENLVFQIMQVFSAPLIVMAAYYLFAPDTRTTSVLVGFASGFASEPILLAIRSLAEKLKPESNEKSSRPTVIGVTITPASVTLSPGQSQLFTATVTNSTNAAVTWSTDPNIGTLLQTGLYTAPATVPAVAANRTITILAVSAADPTKRGSATVSLLP